MRYIWFVLRGYSFVFEAVLSAMALAFGIFLHLIPPSTVNLGWLPWTGTTLAAMLVGLGILGLLSVLLAATGTFRLLHFLFAVAAAVILIRGLFLGSWSFHGMDDFKQSIYLCVGAVVAALGSLPVNVSAKTSTRA